MRRHRAVGWLLFVMALPLISATDTIALLAFRTDDVYVRHSDLILIGETVGLTTDDGSSVALIEPVSVIWGQLPGPQIRVRSHSDTEEDMPHFASGQKALLFLKGTAEGLFWCSGAAAGKRDYSPRTEAVWKRLIDRVTRLVQAREAADDRVRIAKLVELLDSEDSQLAAASSNYLNYLVNGAEHEDWIVIPPENSSTWSWQDYFERNVVAHRKKWKRWWSANGGRVGAAQR